MKKSLLLILIALISAGNISAQNIKSSAIKKHIEYLASDKLKGRLPGTEGDTLAMNYIERHLERSGFSPLYNDPFFEFQFLKGRVEDKSSFIKFGKEPLITGVDYFTVPFSGSGKFTSKVICIDSIPDNVDNLKGSAILFKSSPDAVRMAAVKFADLGASALIFYSDDNSGFNVSDAASQLSIPVICISKDLAYKIKGSPEVEISGAILMNTLRGRSANVVMVKRVKNASGTIMIGAHFDHLGMGEYGSRTPGRREIHNGADDNASGVAAMLEIASSLAENTKSLKFDIVAAAFGGEERGLLGSKALADSMKKAGNLPSIMLNLDMVGRLVDDKIQAGGVGTFKKADSLLALINSDYLFKISETKGGTGASDHSSFYSAGVPVLFFTTGVHQQYHTPEDDPSLINYEGTSKVASYINELAYEFASGRFIPQYTYVEGEAEPVRTSFKVTLGVVPDFTYEVGDGFRIGAISSGKAADIAGLLAGDIIISMGGKPVKNIYEYMARLGELKAGQKTEIVVKREGKTINFTVEL